MLGADQGLEDRVEEELAEVVDGVGDEGCDGEIVGARARFVGGEGFRVDAGEVEEGVFVEGGEFEFGLWSTLGRADGKEGWYVRAVLDSSGRLFGRRQREPLSRRSRRCLVSPRPCRGLFAPRRP